MYVCTIYIHVMFICTKNRVYISARNRTFTGVRLTKRRGGVRGGLYVCYIVDIPMKRTLYKRRPLVNCRRGHVNICKEKER